MFREPNKVPRGVHIEPMVFIGPLKVRIENLERSPYRNKNPFGAILFLEYDYSWPNVQFGALQNMISDLLQIWLSEGYNQRSRKSLT